jgi:hypothetical protein
VDADSSPEIILPATLAAPPDSARAIAGGPATNRRNAVFSGARTCRKQGGAGARTMIKFLLWLILFLLCWPLALLALLLWPVVWLLSIPFKLIGITVQGVFELLRAVVFLPARLLGGRP